MNICHFHGVTSEEIPLVEQIFECQIHILQLKENGTAETVHQASSKHPIKIYLILCGEHLSLITDHLHYTKEFVCKQCGKVLSEIRNLQNHERRCDGTVKYKYPGGVYTNTPSIFEESNGIIVADELKFKKYFAVFDFEAHQQDFNRVQDREQEELGENTTWNKVHEPISYSVSSNIPGAMDVCHFVSVDPKELMNHFVGTLLAIAHQIEKSTHEHFEDI